MGLLSARHRFPTVMVISPMKDAESDMFKQHRRETIRQILDDALLERV